ncbi:hypothetical protein ACIP5Y_41905 [Nocardia sp. NPDC088792]|uniref:hypothetical protein n=1 Tax=Nocardia sp. NPDC088792 TaxID=3364332 RepID=UPI0037F54614
MRKALVLSGRPWWRGLLVTSGLLLGMALLGVGLPQSAAHTTTAMRAEAASGTVSVDGRGYGDPAGCVTIRKVPRRISVSNSLDRSVRIYLFPGCKGGVTHVVDAGRDGRGLGASILPR